MAIPIVDVNYAAVLAAAVVHFIIGMIWYGALFKKPWAKLMGIDQKKAADAKKGMGPRFLASFIAGLIMSFVLAHTIAFSGAVTVAEALMAGFWTWLGYIATVMLGMVLWDGKPIKLYAINVSYYLVGILVMSAILVSM